MDSAYDLPKLMTVYITEVHFIHFLPLKQLFASGSVIIANIHVDFVSDKYE